MSIAGILSSIGERFQSSATVKNVFGEPISVGDRTVVPVARISYGFGGGAGGGPEEGGGGGGRVSAVPAGALEIRPTGTRFIAFTDWRKLAGIAAVSAGLGLLMAGRRKCS